MMAPPRFELGTILGILQFSRCLRSGISVLPFLMKLEHSTRLSHGATKAGLIRVPDTPLSRLELLTLRFQRQANSFVILNRYARSTCCFARSIPQCV